MNRLWYYLSHQYYWRRVVLRLSETFARRLHLETHLETLVSDSLRPLPQRDGAVDNLPGAGIRLLYVAPRFDYGNPARGYSYEENHFLPALVHLGFDVVRFDSLTLIRHLGRRTASDLLVELVFRSRPDVAFFVIFKDDFEPSAVDEVRRLGCVTFNWFTDDHWRFQDFSSHWAPHFSWAITTDPAAVPKYHERGLRHVIRSQWGVNHRLYRPLERPQRYPVSFIGQPHGDRRQTIGQLRRAGLAVEVWGYGWPRGKISTRRAVEVINESSVNLNLSNASVGRVDQIKGRDFEVPACRALLVTKSVPALRDYYTIGDEVLTYDDIDDLVATIRWSLANGDGTDRIREKAYRRVVAEHTYEKRFTDVFRLAGVLR